MLTPEKKPRAQLVGDAAPSPDVTPAQPRTLLSRLTPSPLHEVPVTTYQTSPPISLPSSPRVLWKDPVFLTVAATACVASWCWPPVAMRTLSASTLVATHVIGSIALIAVLTGNSAEDMHKKLQRVSIGTGLFSLQFVTLALSGVFAAWGGAVAMGLACARSLLLSRMQNKSQRTRSVIAGGFIATGTICMLTGFGVVPPLVPWRALISADSNAIATMLPIVASIAGTIASAMPRMRYARPFLMFGGTVNCLYNGIYTGALGHLASEIGSMFIHIRQFLARDFPQAKRGNQHVSLAQRWHIYKAYMRNPALSEDHLQR